MSPKSPSLHPPLSMVLDHATEAGLRSGCELPDPLISLELGLDYAAKRGLKYGCGAPLPLDPLISMMRGHDL